MTHAWALQTSVYGRLAGDAGVKAALGDPARIYDIAPEDAEAPHALIAEWREDALAGSETAFVHDFRLRVVSRYEGRRETREALTAIYNALQDAPLSVAGAALVSLRCVFSDVIPVASGRSWAGVIRFRAVTDAG